MTRHGHSKGDQQLWLWLHLFSKHGVETAHANGKHVDRRRPNPTNRGGGGEEAHRAQSLDERLCGPASSCRSVRSLWRRSHGDASEVRCECAEDGIGNNTPDAIRRAHALPEIPKKRSQLQSQAGSPVCSPSPASAPPTTSNHDSRDTYTHNILDTYGPQTW